MFRFSVFQFLVFAVVFATAKTENLKSEFRFSDFQISIFSFWVVVAAAVAVVVMVMVFNDRTPAVDPRTTGSR